MWGGSDGSVQDTLSSLLVKFFLFGGETVVGLRNKTEGLCEG